LALALWIAAIPYRAENNLPYPPAGYSEHECGQMRMDKPALPGQDGPDPMERGPMLSIDNQHAMLDGRQVDPGEPHFWPAPPQSSGPSQLTARPPAHASWEVQLGEAYDLLEEMARMAKALGTTVARVALAWVQSRPAVAATIIGARTLAQLDDNLAALDVRLEAAQVAKLDQLSKPTLSFPADFIANGAPFLHGGTTIDGRAAEPWPLSPKDDSDRH
jgi:hypothetical protein